MIVYVVESGEKFKPVNVTESPPLTLPKRGDIDVRSGVRAEE